MGLGLDVFWTYKFEEPLLKRMASLIIQILLILTWSSALFELGLPFFVEHLGISIFMLSAFTLLVIVGFWLLLGVKIKNCTFSSGLLNSQHWFIVGYAITYTITVIWSSSFLEGVREAAELWWYILLYIVSLIALNWISGDDRKKIFVYVGWVALSVLTFLAAYRYFSFSDNSIDSKFRLSPFRDYNIFMQAFFVATSSIFLYIRGRYPKFLHIFLFFLLGIFSIMLGIASGSRRVLVLYGPVFLLAPVILSFLRSKKSMRQVALAMIVLFCTIWVGSLKFETIDDDNFEVLLPKIDRALGFITGSYSDDNRLERWEDAISMYNELPVFKSFYGVGARGYYSDSRFVREDGRHDSPHNFILTALLEGGVMLLLVLTLVLLIISVNFISIVRRADFWPAIFLIINGIIWVLSVSISAQGFFDGKMVFLILLTMSVFDRPIDSLRTSRRSESYDSYNVACHTSR
jgi:hypothetical protein